MDSGTISSPETLARGSLFLQKEKQTCRKWLWTSRKGSKEGWGWSFASPGAPPRSGALPPSQEDAPGTTSSLKQFKRVPRQSPSTKSIHSFYESPESCYSVAVGPSLLHTSSTKTFRKRCLQHTWVPRGAASRYLVPSPDGERDFCAFAYPHHPPPPGTHRVCATHVAVARSGVARDRATGHVACA